MKPRSPHAAAWEYGTAVFPEASVNYFDDEEFDDDV